MIPLLHRPKYLPCRAGFIYQQRLSRGVFCDTELIECGEQTSICARYCQAYDWLDACSDFEIAASFAGFLIHRTWSMPCGEASTVTSAIATPSRAISPKGCPFNCIVEKVAFAQKCEGKAAIYFATRSRPTTGTRAAPAIPPPSVTETTCSTKMPLKAARSPVCTAERKASRKRRC